MIPGLLKMFLKKLAGSTADTGNPVGSRKSNSQSGFKSFRLKLATTVLLSIIGCATAFPALAALSIDSATWDGNKLVVQGTDGRGGIVDVFYGYDDPANSTLLGTTSVRGSGDWKLQINSSRNNLLDPVPCAVSATLAGDSPVLNVTVAGADPATCAPQPPVVNNCNISVPTALAFGDVQINTTSSLSTTVSNSGGADCIVTIAQTGSADFTAAPLSFTVVPGASQAVNVDYAPLAVEADNGSLAVASNDPNTPNVDVALSGNGVDNVAVCVPVTNNLSINSTSQSGCPEQTVPEQPTVLNGGFRVLAINDLGMHCGDYDTRISSILPPFQVLLGQVIQRGDKPTLNPVGVSLEYSAASNPNDPVLGQPGVKRGLMDDGSTYKTNFWDAVAGGAYDPFYPGGLGITPLATGGFPVTLDVGLPVPNVEDLYIGPDGKVNSGDEHLTAVQHAMPGLANPYFLNEPQTLNEHYVNKPFFVDFPFGYVAADVNWYEGAGVPFAAYDDFGNENPYPLVRVEARQGVTTVATIDTVLPISGEASCTNCHSDPADQPNSRTSEPTDTLEAAGLPVALSLDDPNPNLPNDVSVEYAADINILRLHDLKHGANYVSTGCDAPDQDCTVTFPAVCDIHANGGNGDVNCLTNQALVQGKPTVCQVCHYTPALDLAQFGPLAGDVGTFANGRNQLAHSSNSNVMHSHHGSLGVDLFPPMPAPIQLADGSIANQTERLTVLEDTCYQCHPGTTSQCLRGAMFNGGMLCNDCHGSMEQVGADFSALVSPTTPGAFVLGGDFYDPADPQPRVPWANEPGCGSCHTGDVSTNIAAANDTMSNIKDINGNSDGIRLRVAYRVNPDGTSKDAKATPIVPLDKRFAEPAVPAEFNGFVNPGAGNPQLYRVSTGHGGVMCEGCHGATHAEWPNGNPMSNDNVTSEQLQGHTGTIIECAACHTNVDALSTDGSLDSLQGPHGMHTVGDNTGFVDHDHKRNINRNACRACHGKDGEGSVLSRTADDRDFTGIKDGGLVPKGTPVTCTECHDNEL